MPWIGGAGHDHRAGRTSRDETPYPKSGPAQCPGRLRGHGRPGTERLTAVTACPHTNGAIVGELLSRVIRGRAKVLVVTGSLATEDHADKLEGFRSSCSLAQVWISPRSSEAHDDQKLAYTETKAYWRRTPISAGFM